MINGLEITESQNTHILQPNDPVPENLSYGNNRKQQHQNKHMHKHA